MSTPVLDPPRVEHSEETVVPPPADITKVERSTGNQASPTKPVQAPKTWPLGAHLTIGAVALFLIAMLAVIAAFSVPSAPYFTLDGAIALAIIVLALVLSLLLAVANRRQSV